MSEYYTPEAVEELIYEINSARDSIKYLFNLPLDAEDAKLRTDELMEMYESLADYCEELVNSYQYYLKAENYLCANNDEMAKHIEEYNKAFKQR